MLPSIFEIPEWSVCFEEYQIYKCYFKENIHKVLCLIVGDVSHYLAGFYELL